MKIIANFCTYSKRKNTINKAVDSIKDQVDLVRVYYNDYIPEMRSDILQTIGPDFTDRGKFVVAGSSEIVFTCDDDIMYPPDYVDYTLRKLNTYGGIVTYHGRKLSGLGKRYYFDHETLHFRWHKGQNDTPIDVPGTGVMAYRSSQFKPNIFRHEYDKMVDLIIALEAAVQDVPITCVRKENNWITAVPTKETIYDSFKDDSSTQDELADMIYKMKGF